MLKKKPDTPEKVDDDVTLRLRAAARKKRPWSYTAILITLAIFLVPVGLLVWSLWPRPAPPAIAVTALDAIALPNEQVALRALVEPIDPQTRKPDLGNYELFFEAGDLAKTAALGQAKTTARGEASLSWQPPPATPLAVFTVRYAGDKTRKPSASQGKIFTFDPNGAVLIVDIAALTPATVETWRTKNVLEIIATAGAGTALKTAHERKYQIVYLATTADRGRLYGKMRGWIENQWAAPEPLPSGPVLGTAGNAAPPLGEIVKGLKARLHGPCFAVAGNTETAKALGAIGGRVFILGGEPVDVRLASWRDLEAHLPVNIR